jgi:hypothetical protein
MTAYQRANGECVILTEDAGHNHIVLTRWCPSGPGTSTSTVPAAPAGRTASPGSTQAN